VISAGACGYLLKSIAGADLVDAITAAAGGRATFSTEALSMLPNRAATQRIGANLTPRELDVLEALVHGESNKEIAKSLSLSAGTVRVHVSNILSKLQVENRTAAAFVAQQHRLVGTSRAGFSAPN
jgi:DNA-binding NarL/FixJ family response regulator